MKITETFAIALISLTILFKNTTEAHSLKTTEKLNVSLTDTGKITYLALGDSYTVGAAEAHENSYPYQLVKSLRQKGLNIDSANVVAKIGWTTQDLKKGLAKIPGDQKFDVITLLIGVNNQFQHLSIDDYSKDFHELLAYAIAHCKGGASQVFVLSIPNWSVTPFGKIRNVDKISSEINAFNDVNRKESLQQKVKYIDITSVSLDADTDKSLTANDGLHPSGKLYTLWVKRISPKIAALFKLK